MRFQAEDKNKPNQKLHQAIKEKGCRRDSSVKNAVSLLFDFSSGWKEFAPQGENSPLQEENPFSKANIKLQKLSFLKWEQNSLHLSILIK